jgi:hypothetical protein
MKDAGVDGLKKDMMEMRQSINTSASAPTTPVANTTAPKFPSGNIFANSNAVRDFETHFGNTGSTGETRVAGALHLEPETNT